MNATRIRAFDIFMLNKRVNEKIRYHVEIRFHVEMRIHEKLRMLAGLAACAESRHLDLDKTSAATGSGRTTPAVATCSGLGACARWAA